MWCLRLQGIIQWESGLGKMWHCDLKRLIHWLWCFPKVKLTVTGRCRETIQASRQLR